jgi:hypothetical protein
MDNDQYALHGAIYVVVWDACAGALDLATSPIGSVSGNLGKPTIR